MIIYIKSLFSNIVNLKERHLSYFVHGFRGIFLRIVYTFHVYLYWKSDEKLTEMVIIKQGDHEVASGA